MADGGIFQTLRQQAKQESQAGRQKQKEALKRRFAQLGQTTSGAAIKAETGVEQEAEKQLSQQLGKIGVAEQQEMQRRKEIGEAREFVAGEAQKGRLFTAEQARLGRLFATGERKAGQEFAAGQAKLGREFATTERQAGQEFAASQNQLAREQAQKQFEANFAQSVEQFEKNFGFVERQFNEEIRVNDFNMQTAQSELNKPGMIGQLFEDFGLGGGPSTALDFAVTGGVGTAIKEAYDYGKKIAENIKF